MEVKLSLFGFGNVGRAVARVLLEKETFFKERYSLSFKVVSIADTSGTVWLPEGIDLREALTVKETFGKLSAWTNDYEVYNFTPKEAVQEIDADIVIDVTNDKNAYGWHLTALRDGKAVVTSNKPPLAFHYAELMEEANKRSLPYLFEATVMAGTPIIMLLRHGLMGDTVERIEAVLNATTTFILSEMEKGLDFDDALKKAQKLGIAERDPSGDILGIDAGYKATILHCLAFEPITFDMASVKGIVEVTPGEIERAKAKGKTIRLVATVEEGRIVVGPKEIPKNSPLAVESHENAAVIKTDLLGELVIKGAGAGLKETASGVVSDIVMAALMMR
ncbi:homoserine dehydrogenase [Thermococcus sp. GR7]|uniref:homoserine dehydrogenase n=1 Tax=unclassified Thermococcus TaxID=2627626 RepID=UPI001431B539|nr:MULTISPECIES: homoserine dehydrogenase [unclassified Thermococcus]NJE47144.1 homoserine dehydrogenase [Thermococcus sp. GR7]NJE78031.1 homoserine dehydrogenase [Thermococcus sp. GR4]NJF22852.1 homoserine dehydrogenase [Thermococcus sp. GR5]